MDDATPDGRFDDQLTAMIQAREDGLIGGVGLSNITVEQLLRALESTPVVCVQNPLNLADRASMPLLEECTTRGIAFVPFFPLGSGFVRPNPVLDNEQVRHIADRLGLTAAQVALAWTFRLAPNVLLIPGTSSVRHLEENLAVADIELDEEAQQQLAAVAK
jgi:aryl-alcohol dehydrogenase-like predicted oxidoreductase